MVSIIGLVFHLPGVFGAGICEDWPRASEVVNGRVALSRYLDEVTDVRVL